MNNVSTLSINNKEDQLNETMCQFNAYLAYDDQSIDEDHSYHHQVESEGRSILHDEAIFELYEVIFENRNLSFDSIYCMLELRSYLPFTAESYFHRFHEMLQSDNIINQDASFPYDRNTNAGIKKKFYNGGSLKTVEEIFGSSMTTSVLDGSPRSFNRNDQYSHESVNCDLDETYFTWENSDV